MNEDARRIAVQRSRVVSAMRASLDARGFLEVETPVLQPLYGGAAARPFTTHHNTYDQDLYLRISDELYLKRLVVGGLDRVYEIGRVFRNEGVSRKHNPEFTMMECYQAYADYRDMMALAQALVQEIAARVLGTTRVQFSGPRARAGRGMAPRDAARRDRRRHRHRRARARRSSRRCATRFARAGRDPGDAPSWGRLVDDLFSVHVEPSLIQPTFVTDYPVELSPLAKRSPSDPRLVERFEPFLAGMEIGNAFSELNDPDDQRERLLASRRAFEAGDEEAHPLDEDYLRALEVGLPPTGGLGMGVDRLAMILCGAPNLREVITFPHMRPTRRGGRMNELLVGAWTVLTAAGGTVALGLILAIALGINAMTLLFFGSAVVALERFARVATRRGVIAACVAGLGRAARRVLALLERRRARRRRPRAAAARVRPRQRVGRGARVRFRALVSHRAALRRAAAARRGGARGARRRDRARARRHRAT